jgi:hypothetical protein
MKAEELFAKVQEVVSVNFNQLIEGLETVEYDECEDCDAWPREVQDAWGKLKAKISAAKMAKSELLGNIREHFSSKDGPF